MKLIGDCWWDFDENQNIAIECEKPLVGKHYLLTIHTPKFRVDKNGKRTTSGCASDAVEIAEKIVKLLNSMK